MCRHQHSQCLQNMVINSFIFPSRIDLEFTSFWFPTFLHFIIFFPVSSTDNHHQVPLRNGCIKRLHQIHAWLQAHSGTQSPLQQTNPEPQPMAQLKVQAYREWSQLLLEDCALLLLTHLTELQEVQASALLQAMMDGVSRGNHNIQVKARKPTKGCNVNSGASCLFV